MLTHFVGGPLELTRHALVLDEQLFAFERKRLALSLDVLEQKGARGPLAIEWQPVIASITGLNRRRTREKSPRECRDYGLKLNE